MALRKFSLNGALHYLVVDINTLHTAIVSAEHVFLEGGKYTSFGGIPSGHISPYFGALRFCSMPPFRLHNHGIRGFSRKSGGVVLSTDLCPSKFSLDRRPFQSVLTAFSAKDRPLPVAIAISGKWLESHPADTEWLIFLHEKKMLDITWINHSYTHPREYRLKPRILSKGFLLTEGVNFTDEIFKTEIAMIEAGITPSVFFRFPGLVANDKLVKKACELGLIPVGSNAWLAKRERPREGSIVLIHANRHEPKGVALFLGMLSARRNNIRQGKWKLLDIRNCLADEFSLLANNTRKKVKIARANY